MNKRKFRMKCLNELRLVERTIMAMGFFTAWVETEKKRTIKVLNFYNKKGKFDRKLVEHFIGSVRAGLNGSLDKNWVNTEEWEPTEYVTHLCIVYYDTL